MPTLSEGMTRAELESEAIKLTADYFKADIGRVTLETSFISDMDADSLDTVEFIMAVEDRFDEDIADDEAEKILTVGDLVTWLEGRK